jgi:hypothetical protein
VSFSWVFSISSSSRSLNDFTFLHASTICNDDPPNHHHVTSFSFWRLATTRALSKYSPSLHLVSMPSSRSTWYIYCETCLHPHVFRPIRPMSPTCDGPMMMPTCFPRVVLTLRFASGETVEFSNFVLLVFPHIFRFGIGLGNGRPGSRTQR